MEASTHVRPVRRARPLARRVRDLAVSLHPGLILCVLVIAWAAVPLVVLAARVFIGDETPTGAYGLIATDQLQYLAWIREAGDHGLISNLFQIGPSEAVFVHPFFFGSGLLWKLGLPLQLAYLLWAPVTVAVLLYGVASYAQRLLPAGRPRWAALVLALFMAPPIIPLLDLFGVAVGIEPLELLRAFGYELTAAGFLWGWLPKAMAIGLMPLVFLAAERGVTRRSERRVRSLLLAAAGAILVAWLTPWQGVTLIVVFGGLLVWYRFDRRKLPLMAVIAAASLPLLYYFALSRTNDDWATAALDLWPTLGPAAWVVAVLGISPFLVLAVRGALGPRTMQDRVLILWPLACVVTLLIPSAGWFYAPAGASIPLAILMVRGWRSLRVARLVKSPRVATVAAVGLLAVVAIPGPVYLAKRFKTQVQVNWFNYYMDPGERQALSFLERSPARGAVLASPGYGTVVAAMTGRQTWSGHFAWTPNFFARETAVRRLFLGRMSPGERHDLLVRSGATFVMSDCRFPPPVAERRLGNAVTPVRRFGCATVYRINGSRPGT